MILLNRADVAYITNFVDEVMALYEADEEAIFPRQIEDMAKNVYVILRSGSLRPQKEDNNNNDT